MNSMPPEVRFWNGNVTASFEWLYSQLSVSLPLGDNIDTQMGKKHCDFKASVLTNWFIVIIIFFKKN